MRTKQGKIGKLVADEADRFEEKPHAIFERAAIGVVPTVDARRKELLEQISVGRVNFDGVVSGAPQPAGRIEEIALDRANFVDTQRTHRLAGCRMATRSRADWLHAENGTAAATGRGD